MALVGAARLVARMGVARQGTTRMGVLSLSTVGTYKETASGIRSLWKKVSPPNTVWERVS